MKLQYEHVEQCILQNGCTLITTKDEFIANHMNSKSFYDIIATCGHPNRVKYDMFKAQSCGIKCKLCTVLSVKSKLQKESNNADIEYQGFCYLRDILQPTFQVKKCNEGTCADFAVKLSKNETDSWVPVQLKVTKQFSKQYSNNYTFNMGASNYYIPVILLCLQDKRTWIMDGAGIQGLQSIRIGSKRSKYSANEVLHIVEFFANKWDGFEKHTFESINIPISKNQQREQVYRRLREQYLSYIDFVYPECEGLVYDFMINGKKVQEKVASYQIKRQKRCDSSYVVKLSRSTTAKKTRQYEYGENDFYWINLPNCTTFFVIPEEVMLQYGKISNKGECNPKTSMLAVYPTKREKSKTNWMHNYAYDYKTITSEQINSIFGMQVT